MSETDPAFEALLSSDRVSARTRDVLRTRARPIEAPAGLLDAEAAATLAAAIGRILPQPAGMEIDLAARVEQALAGGPGDGWRYAALPGDVEACRRGLAALDVAARRAHGAPFAEIGSEAQDALLTEAAYGRTEAAGGLDAEQMRLWSEDLRAAAVKAYVAHPATLARIGYDGFAYGGDGWRKQGFTALEPGEREPWERLPAPDARR